MFGDMIYKFDSFSKFDSPVKALVVALGYVDELEEHYCTPIYSVNIYELNGFRKYSIRIG